MQDAIYWCNMWGNPRDVTGKAGNKKQALLMSVTHDVIEFPLSSRIISLALTILKLKFFWIFSSKLLNVLKISENNEFVWFSSYRLQTYIMFSVTLAGPSTKRFNELFEVLFKSHLFQVKVYEKDVKINVKNEQWSQTSKTRTFSKYINLLMWRKFKITMETGNIKRILNVTTGNTQIRVLVRAMSILNSILDV